MKRFLISGLTIILSSMVLASAANAKPLNFESEAADLNGDGVVTMFELRQYHLDHQSK